MVFVLERRKQHFLSLIPINWNNIKDSNPTYTTYIHGDSDQSMLSDSNQIDEKSCEFLLNSESGSSCGSEKSEQNEDANTNNNNNTNANNHTINCDFDCKSSSGDESNSAQNKHNLEHYFHINTNTTTTNNNNIISDSECSSSQQSYDSHHSDQNNNEGNSFESDNFDDFSVILDSGDSADTN